MLTQYFNSFVRLFITPVLFVPVIFLAACGGGGGSSTDPITPAQTDFSNITNSQAQAAAKNLIGGNVNQTIAALGAIATSSSAINTSASSVGIQIPDTFSTTSSLTRAVDNSATAAIEQQILEAIDLLFNSGIRVGDTITYDPDEQAMCANALMEQLPGLADNLDELLADSSDDSTDTDDTSSAIEDCVDLYKHVTVVLTILGDEQGTLVIKYDSFNFLTIGYKTDETYAEIDLAQLKSIIEAIATLDDQAEDPDLPSVFEGVIRLTSTVLGTDNGKITLSIEQDINVVDDTDDTTESDTSISVAATPKVIELTANATDNTASVEVALASINAIFPFDVDPDTERQGDLFIPGLTLKAELSSNGDQLVFSNVGIGNSTLVFDVSDLSILFLDEGVNQDESAEDFKITLDTFGFTIDGTQKTIAFPEMFTALLQINDEFDLLEAFQFEGSLELTVGEGTVLEPKQNSSSEDVIEVKSGFVSEVATEDFDPDANFTVGSCFTGNDDLFDVLSGKPQIPLIEASCLE